MKSEISSKGVTDSASDARSVRIPITNVYDGNDYSAQILVGSQRTPVNVTLDTGSSTLAVSPSVYDAASDKDLKPTAYAQLFNYGTGGWAGPVINTSLAIGSEGRGVSMQSVSLAITDVQEKGNFDGVGGILGLAYSSLNDAYDFTQYFKKNTPGSPYSYPWPFPGGSFAAFSKNFQQLIAAQRIPKVEVTPCFTELEQDGVTANKFAFYTLRSCTHFATSDKNKIAADPLNNGFLVLGGGEDQSDLYTGAFANAAVLHDVYYNTNLKAVKVEGCKPVNALPLQSQYQPFMISNSIIDSGTGGLALSKELQDGILQSLKTLNPKFAALINKANNDDKTQYSIPVSELDLASWPNIYFILTGENGEDIQLTCSPQTYWQVNNPKPGMAGFQIVGPSVEGANYSILGLTLMNNYYTVFDRSSDASGVIRFAAIKQP